MVEIYLSYVGDSMEVNRHLIGALCRLSLMIIICVALAVDRLLAREPVG